jgi:hypothetical protein
MPDISSALSVAWREASPVSAALAIAWRDAARVQSIGSGFTPIDTPGGTPVPPGGDLSPGVALVGDAYSYVPHELRVFDLRDDSDLQADRVNISFSDGGMHHTVSIEGPASLADALRAGEQPAQIGVEINSDVWHFVVEEINQPFAFARDSVTIRGRSLAALGGAPYQAEQQWLVEAPTTSEQLAAIAQSFTGLEVDWQVGAWLMPADSWSFVGDPLALVQALATAVGADVIAERAGFKVVVKPRYDTPPNIWATTAPAWQIPWALVESAQQTRADTAEYDGIIVAGPRTGDILQARLAGTSGARQAPMVTDPALTDTEALRLRAESTLLSYGKQVRETRRLQIHSRVVPIGDLIRWVEPAGTWTGRVRAYSVDATQTNATQTLILERRTGWISGSVGLPTPLPPPPPAASLYAQQVATPTGGADGQPLAVPAHAAGDLLIMWLRAVNSDSGFPAVPAGWSSIATGGNGGNMVRWRLVYRVDETNSINSVPIQQPGSSRPRWVAVFPKARVVDWVVSAEGSGAISAVSNFPAVSLTTPQSIIVMLSVAAGPRFLDYTGPLTLVGQNNFGTTGFDASLSDSWGIWRSGPYSSGVWPGDTITWRLIAGGAAVAAYRVNIAIELKPA